MNALRMLARCLAVVAASTLDAHAATIVVTSDSADRNVSTDCVLRDAIVYANSGVPTGGCGQAQFAAPRVDAPTTSITNIIELPAASTIDLTGIDDLDRNVGLPAITSLLVIHGNGSTIRRNPALPCTPDAALAPGEFGLIFNEGTLTLSNLILSDGCADAPNGSAASGGAIYNAGYLTLESVELRGNYAHFDGGAIFSIGSGGTTGSIDVADAVFADNNARSGGAIYVAGAGPVLKVERALFRANAAGEFFAGGALYLASGVDASVVNATFAQNSAGSSSAIQADGTVALAFVTIAENLTLSGSGAALQAPAATPVQKLTLRHSIIAANEGGDGNCRVQDSNVDASAPNLSSDASCGGFTLGGTDAMLLPLPASGLAAYALAPQSPAVDAAADCNDADGAAVVTDQRGLSRPQGGACDLGAFELDDRIFGAAFEFIAY